MGRLTIVMKQRMRATEKQKRQREYKDASRYIVYLLRSTLNQTELRKPPENCTWETIWDLVERNYIAPLIGTYIQEYSDLVPEEIRSAGKAAYNENLYRQICFDIEREKIVKELEKQELACLMLKGVNISAYYPKAGMRWMSDNDILCDYIQADESGGYRIKGETDEGIEYWKEKTCAGIQVAMEKCGFSLKGRSACHDAYIKQPMFKFEMHHQLFQKSFDEEKAIYYENPWSRAIPDGQNPYRYYYSKEDEYIYFVTHAYKHFSRSGSGIRTLTDLYFYIKNDKSMDWNYISEQLKVLKLENFETLLRNTAVHAFSRQGKMTTEEWNTVLYMIGSGIFGTSQNRIRNCMKTNGKNKVWHYIVDRVWLSDSVTEENFPFFYHHRFYRPFLPIYRFIRGILTHPKKIWTEWIILFRMEKNER